MALDDYVESQVAVAVAATAAVFSPRARGMLRQGAVYGVAGVLKAADVATGAARGAARGVRQDEASTDGAEPSTASRPATRSPRATKPKTTT